MKTSKDIIYPIRVGRKQKRAVVDANGIEIVIFPEGMEDMAEIFCRHLNVTAAMDRVSDIISSPKYDPWKVTDLLFSWDAFIKMYGK